MSLLAGNEGSAYTPPELFANDADIITNSHPVASGVNVAANSILAWNLAGDGLIEWVPGAADATGVAVAISCEAIDTTGGAANHPVYEGGYFNTDALNWPAATDAQKREAFRGTNIHHRSLGYSG